MIYWDKVTRTLWSFGITKYCIFISSCLALVSGVSDVVYPEYFLFISLRPPVLLFQLSPCKKGFISNAISIIEPFMESPNI